MIVNLRKQSLKLALAVVLAGITAGAAFCAVSDRAQFDVIVDKKPFGAPLPLDPIGPKSNTIAPPVVAPPPQLTLRVTMIRHDDKVGDRCALEDTRNPLWHAYLGVGEKQDDVTIKEINVVKGEVLLEKAGFSYTLPIGGTGVPLSASGQPMPAKMGYPATTSPRAVARVTPVAPPAGPPEPDLKTEPPRMTGPALDKHFQEYQKEIIRSGGEIGPALPIPLTQETDDELVAEGLLPPMQ